MSGIFKSIKKMFKSIGKMVKKILPILAIAAGVYFGGAYLMSAAGGANSLAARSVLSSFQKAGGVWKGFFNGLMSGKPLMSAAAFAEGSYKASLVEGSTLATQIAAGQHGVSLVGQGLDLATIGTQTSKYTGDLMSALNGGMDLSQAKQHAFTQSSSAVSELLQTKGASATTIVPTVATGDTPTIDPNAITSDAASLAQAPSTGTPTGIVKQGLNASDPGYFDQTTGVDPATGGFNPVSVAPAAGATALKDASEQMLSQTLANVDKQQTADEKYLDILSKNLESSRKLGWLKLGTSFLGGLLQKDPEEERREYLRNWEEDPVGSDDPNKKPVIWTPEMKRVATRYV